MKGLKVIGFIVGSYLTINMAGAINPPATGRYVKEHQIIQNDLFNLNVHTRAVKSLKEECKADRKAGRKMALITHKKELRKAEADVSRDKTYLVADKKDLKSEYQLACAEHKKVLDRSSADLTKAKRKLSKDVKEGNEVTIQADAVMVATLIKRNEANEQALVALRTDRNEDMIAVNKEIQKSDAQFVAVTYSENGFAYVSNWLIK